MFDRYAYISMYLISKLVFINIVLFSGFILLEIRMVWLFLYNIVLFLKVKQMVNTIKNLIIDCFEQILFLDLVI